MILKTKNTSDHYNRMNQPPVFTYSVVNEKDSWSSVLTRKPVIQQLSQWFERELNGNIKEIYDRGYNFWIFLLIIYFRMFFHQHSIRDRSEDKIQKRVKFLKFSQLTEIETLNAYILI